MGNSPLHRLARLDDIEALEMYWGVTEESLQGVDRAVRTRTSLFANPQAAAMYERERAAYEANHPDCLPSAADSAARNRVAAQFDMELIKKPSKTERDPQVEAALDAIEDEGVNLGDEAKDRIRARVRVFGEKPVDALRKVLTDEAQARHEQDNSDELPQSRREGATPESLLDGFGQSDPDTYAALTSATVRILEDNPAMSQREAEQRAFSETRIQLPGCQTRITAE